MFSNNKPHKCLLPQKALTLEKNHGDLMENINVRTTSVITSKTRPAKWRLREVRRDALAQQLAAILAIQRYTLPFKSLGSPRQFCVFHENSLLFIK